MNRPDVPKRLAAKIRAAQERVSDKQQGIFHGGRSLAEAAARVAEFDAYPASFAARHYPGHGVDSYPVQTNISRTREKLAYQIRRKDERHNELKTVIAELETLEAEVLATVRAMRPAGGRVPWPDAPADLKTSHRQLAAERDRLLAELEERRAREARDFEEAQAVQDAKWEDERAREEEAMRRDIEAMPPDERAALKAAWANLRADLESGRLSMEDVLAALRKHSSE